MEQNKTLTILTSELLDLREHAEKHVNKDTGELPTVLAAKLGEALSLVEEKIDRVVAFEKRCGFELDLIQSRIDNMEQEKKLWQDRQDWIKRSVHDSLHMMGEKKLIGPKGSIVSLRDSERVDIYDPKLLPDEYLAEQKLPPREPDKLLIKKLLNMGMEIPGARITLHQTVQLK